MNTAHIVSLVVAASLSAGAFAQSPGRTRAEVRQETAAAIRSGDTAAPGDSGLTHRELRPSAYAAPRDKVVRKTAAVKSAKRADPARAKSAAEAP